MLLGSWFVRAKAVFVFPFSVSSVSSPFFTPGNAESSIFLDKSVQRFQRFLQGTGRAYPRPSRRLRHPLDRAAALLDPLSPLWETLETLDITPCGVTLLSVSRLFLGVETLETLNGRQAP